MFIIKIVLKLSLLFPNFTQFSNKILHKIPLIFSTHCTINTYSPFCAYWRTHHYNTFSRLITPKITQNWLFWLKIVRKISSPTNFTEWNHDFICIFTSYKLQKCEKYNLPQIHHIRTYCNSKVLWYIFKCPFWSFELNCV